MTSSLSFRFALLASLACLSSSALAQNLTYTVDPTGSPFTFGGTSSAGPIVGTPNTFNLGGTLLVDPTYVGGAIAGAELVGGSAVTIPAVLAGQVPSGIPGLPLASLTVNGLRLAAGSPPFAVGAGGAFSTIVTFTVTQGTVNFVPLIGSPGSADITGLMSDPTAVSGTLSQTGTETRLVFALVTTIPFNEPALGVSGTINLTGTVDAGFLFVEGFCFGDGTGSACPCGNQSPVGARAGCLHSLGTGGTLATTGVASVSADTLLLQGAGMPATATVLYFQGSAQAAGGAGTAFGDGLLCASGSVIRLGARINVGGASSFPATGNGLAVRGQIPPGGATRWYQGWYRNQSSTFCTPERFNLTNGVRVTWIP